MAVDKEAATHNKGREGYLWRRFGRERSKRYRLRKFWVAVIATSGRRFDYQNELLGLRKKGSTDHKLQGRRDRERECLSFALSLSETRGVRDLTSAVGWCL